MLCYKPDYYDKFHCLASACPDTCCQEWEVDIDPQTFAFYQTVPGELGQKIRSHLKENEDGPAIAMVNGKCPLCGADGLCEIQVQLGHSALSQVCRQFPRLRHDYGSFVELGLELSCPEAARLVLTEPWQISLLEINEPEEESPDPFAMEVLCTTRAEALKLIANQELSLPHALAVLLLYGYSAQSQLDGGPQAVLSPAEDLEEARTYAGAPDFASFAAFFQRLEILTPQWSGLLDSLHGLYRWNAAHKALARYLICRYWYQAVSDYDLVSRVKLIIVCCILVCSLGEDTVDLAHLFSKEIENDADNIDSILDACYTEPALTDRNLLSMLLST